jgi:hypothetical protein
MTEQEAPATDTSEDSEKDGDENPEDVEKLVGEIVERARQDTFWFKLFNWLGTPGGDERAKQILAITQLWVQGKAAQGAKELESRGTAEIENVKQGWRVAFVEMLVRNVALVGSMAAIVALSLTDKLDETTVGFFSAIVGYVLGRQTKSSA